MNWLPFQGAPFRALFVYHVRMLRRLLFGKKTHRDFEPNNMAVAPLPLKGAHIPG